MVTLEQIRKDLEKIFQEDKELHFVEVRADSLDEALADAAVQLDCRVSVLEYDMLICNNINIIETKGEK